MASDALYNRAMRYSLVIFDLDGTLADSLPWFRRNVNDVADRFGFSRVGDEDDQSLRQAGSREILRRLKVPLWKLPAIARHMQRMKAKHLADIPLFPGTAAMLRSLRDGGLTLALVSSDNEANAQQRSGQCITPVRAFRLRCLAARQGRKIPPRREARRPHTVKGDLDRR